MVTFELHIVMGAVKQTVNVSHVDCIAVLQLVASTSRVKLSVQLRALSSSARINVAPRLSTPISVDKKTHVNTRKARR